MRECWNYWLVKTVDESPGERCPAFAGIFLYNDAIPSQHLTMADRKAELERKKAKLMALREEKERRKREKEQKEVSPYLTFLPESSIHLAVDSLPCPRLTCPCFTTLLYTRKEARRWSKAN